MDMLKRGQIAQADLTDWRRLAQGLHARYLVDSFGAGARFVLARRITEIAADENLDADPAAVSEVELGLDTAGSATIAPVWAALLTGSAEGRGRGFGDGGENETAGQQFHVEVYVAPEVAEQRIAAVLAAGGTVVDDSDAPGLTVIADQDGNKGVLCVDVSAAKKD